jgi:hypothetical protein
LQPVQLEYTSELRHTCPLTWWGLHLCTGPAGHVRSDQARWHSFDSDDGAPLISKVVHVSKAAWGHNNSLTLETLQHVTAGIMVYFTKHRTADPSRRACQYSTQQSHVLGPNRRSSELRLMGLLDDPAICQAFNMHPARRMTMFP